MNEEKINKRILYYAHSNLLNKRVLKFFAVGLSGFIVNMGVLYVLSEFFNIYYIVSSIIAIEISILTNFILNDLWTWGDRAKKSLFNRLIQYHISVGITAILINWLFLIFFTEVIGVYYLISNLIGIAAGTLFNFIINDIWTFKNQVKIKDVDI